MPRVIWLKIGDFLQGTRLDHLFYLSCIDMVQIL